MALNSTMIKQLNNSNSAMQRAQIGTLLGFLGPVGDIYYLDPTNGSNSNDGKSVATAKATLEGTTGAYNLLVNNHNDVLVYLADTTSLTVSSAFNWAKSYTHFVGMCAPTRVGQRARIFQLSTLTGASPFFTVSGSGCIFKDLYFFQGVNDATSLINVSVTGGRNFFDNIHFAGGGHAAQAVDGGASLKLDGAEENTFVNCTIGVDTVGAASGMVGILFDGEAHRNIFEKCHVSIWASNAGAAWVELADATAIDRYTIFDNCLFTNTGSSLTSGFVIPAGMGSPRRLFMKDCVGFGAAKWDANDRGVLFGNMNAVTGADLSGVMVEMIS